MVLLGFSHRSQTRPQKPLPKGICAFSSSIAVRLKPYPPSANGHSPSSFVFIVPLCLGTGREWGFQVCHPVSHSDTILNPCGGRPLPWIFLQLKTAKALHLEHL
jgi:hypothetical protein